ncbi:MAG: biotin--[acetyl-CoA-carboxylase] ligase [Leptolyngbyaceae cyanobacterium bins.302]|nr:biotin--[acetyl-CoA-carboxylase] ligase [Leptolyngbyaceae cyanobacterium bins.302]
MVKFDAQRFFAAFQVVQQSGAYPLVVGVEQRSHFLESVPSTNQTAWELMTQDRTLEPIVIASSQTAGRGQWGRQWQSAAGGLYLSVGLKLGMPVTQAAQLTLGTVWGIATALRQIPARLSGVTAGIPVQIKWLNDLVLHRYKLGGILTETRIQQEQIISAVIGVGINWTNPVPETGINLQTFLSDHPDPLIESLEMLAAIALQGIFAGVQRWQAGEIEPLLQDYLALLAHRDRPVLVDGKPWTIVSITPAGDLRVQPKFLAMTEAEPIEYNSLSEVLIQPGTISLGYPL